MADSTARAKERIVCCIGDIHGYLKKLENLWSNLEISLGPSDFSTALIIFLGDYCDRGPNTKEVIDFLISLPLKYPNQSHVFLCGNHDLAFAAFLGLLPSPPDGSPFSETWKEYEMNEEREGWYKGEGYENMHLQGRRWAGRMSGYNHAKKTEYKGSIYDAGPTFQSYGVPHGSADLMKAVPDEQKKFLADLVWIHEEDNVYVETNDGLRNCKLIAVHAGLEKGRDVTEQLNFLKAKDTRIPKVEALSGRKNVWDIPEELAKTPTIVVSGHHAKVHVEDYRLIIDQGGGLEYNPVAAIVLPSKKMVRDTDNLIEAKMQNQMTLQNQLALVRSGEVSGSLSFSCSSTKEDEEMSISALAAFMAKEEEIEKRKLDVKERVQAQLSRVEEEARRLTTICEELDSLADPLKEVAIVRKKIDAVKKELKPLGLTCQKKEREYKEALDAVCEKNTEKQQLITRLMELINESEWLRMKKLEELSKSVETIDMSKR